MEKKEEKIMTKEEFYKDFINWASQFGELGKLCFYQGTEEPFIRAGYSEVRYSDYIEQINQ
jgi:hypothetical protein